MSIALQTIEQQIAELEARRREIIALEKMGVITEVRGKIKQYGLSAVDCGFGDLKEKTTLAPKYRNPANHSQTWAARGQQPKWLAEAIARGAKLEDFAV